MNILNRINGKPYLESLFSKYFCINKLNGLDIGANKGNYNTLYLPGGGYLEFDFNEDTKFISISSFNIYEDINKRILPTLFSKCKNSLECLHLSDPLCISSKMIPNLFNGLEEFTNSKYQNK